MFPRSIAIAGAWGYIGRRFLDVALARGLKTYVFDPGPLPADVDAGRLTRLTDEAAFYAVQADVFHLAVQPEHRRVDWLLARGEPLLILNEKPMAEPDRPEQCRQVLAAMDASPALMFFDFPELFDPLTARIVEFLGQFRRVELTEFVVQRSKDREDPRNPRNYKRMAPIQYQESVHCLAFVLFVLGAVRGSWRDALADGLSIEGESALYTPPNPEAYAQAVDGRCSYRASLGGVRVEGLTDFKRGAPWVKRRIIRGTGDRRPFEIDVSFLEGAKRLTIDGQDQPCDPAADSYAQVLAKSYSWSQTVDRARLMTGLYPNPAFTRLTYQLSAALWRSCRDRRAVTLASLDALIDFDARR
jgi:predicted dehydrogenase